jgi:hypothetical protein
VTDIYLEIKADKRELHSEDIPQDLWQISTGLHSITAHKIAVFIATNSRLRKLM